MQIRHETLADFDAIHDLTWSAFKPMPFSDDTEADAIRMLRADGDLLISLVAEEGGAVVGHVAFTRAAIDGIHDNWFCLGPISVKPGMQRKGIGKSLIHRGLELLRERGARGCVLIGNPDIYSRAGFVSDGRLTYRDLDTKYVQWLAFAAAPPAGELSFARGLEAT